MHFVIRQRGKWWHVDARGVEFEGGKYRESLRTTSREEASELAPVVVAQELARLKSGPEPGLLAVLTAAIAKRRNEQTRSCYTNKAKAICKTLGADTPLRALTADVLKDYFEDRANSVSDHTINKEATVLRLALGDVVPKWAANYVGRTRFLSYEEAEQLVAVASHRAQAWIMFALYTSAEPAALRRMSWADIHRHTNTVHVRGTKYSKRDRFVPMHPALKTFLDTRDQAEPMVEPWNQQNRRRDLTRWCIKAGIEYCTMLDLRRTFCSWLKQAGVDSKTAADMMGHSTTSMVDRIYGQLNRSAYDNAIAQLQSFWPGHKQGHNANIGKAETD